MSLRPATLIVILALLISYSMGLLVTLGMVTLKSQEQADLYYGASSSLHSLSLINFFVALYIKQK
jgi:hypothetical protein